jgi:hypothetical protein
MRGIELKRAKEEVPSVKRLSNASGDNEGL